jgi:hypothetical protein
MVVCVYYSQLAAATQIDGTLNDESDEDTGFVTEIVIPSGSFVDTAPNVPPKPGDTWRLNLYRIGSMHFAADSVATKRMATPTAE